MFTYYTKRFYALLAAVAFMVAPAHALTAEEALAKLLLDRSSSVLSQLTDLEERGKLTSLSALDIIRSDMSPLLNFPKFTQRAMGKHWKRVDIETRDKITAAFRMLLENTYAKVLAQYSGQEVTLQEAKLLEEDAVSVVLEVKGNGKTAQIDYIFTKSDEETAGEYQISDIKVEGISLVANYRRQFASVINKGGVEDLAKRLEHMAEVRIK